MKKADKIKLAEQLYTKLTDIGITLKVEGNWTKMEGGPIPPVLLLESGQYPNELKAIVLARAAKKSL